MTHFFSPLRTALASALLLIATAATTQTFITFDVPNSQYTQPKAINPAGVITGNYYDASGRHGFLRGVNGIFDVFDPPVAFPDDPNVTSPTSINAKGEIVGYAVKLITSRYFSFLRKKDGSFVDFSFPTCTFSESEKAWHAIVGGVDGSAATDINAKGEVTGVFGYISLQSFVRRKDGSTICFEVPSDAPNPVTEALAINSRGQITGYYLASSGARQGFVREPDGTILTFNVPNTWETVPIDIAENGRITGEADSHGFVRERDGTVAIFEVPGSLGTFPVALNSRGQIAGYYADENFVYHGFVRQVDATLSVFDVPNASSTSPAGMNERGDITGWYSDISGGVHGFILEGSEN